MTKPRIIGLVTVVLAGLLAPLLAAPTAQAAPAVAVRDSTAETTRTIPAYKDQDDPTRTIRVFQVTFTAQAGQKFYITSKVNAKQASSTPDELLMAAVSVVCSPKSSPKSSAGATQNTLRGTTTALTPRMVYTAPSDGTVTCNLNATGLRPRPAGGTTSNVWTVDNGSFLSASVEIPSWAKHLHSTDVSKVISAGQQWTPIKQNVTVGEDVSTFELVADHKVTTCSSVGGSRDSTTGGRNLCEGRVSTEGTDVTVDTIVRQISDSGAICKQQTVSQRTMHVDRNIHHGMIFGKGVVELDPACGNRLQVLSTVKATWGADLMVHAPSEVILIIPR